MPSAVSRRSFVLGGAAIAGSLAATTLPASAKTKVPTHSTGKASVRPTGSGYTRYEDLYRSGDTVGDALARLTDPNIVTFPEGQFVASDFNSGFQSGINIPKICRGIVGSGRGTVGGSTGTVFTMKPMSSTKGGGARDSSGKLYVPVQDNVTPCQLGVLKQLDQAAPAVFSHFQVAGTEQGHIFSGFQVHNSAGRNFFGDILITGWSGDNGAPPGETWALAVGGPGAHLLAGVEVDGRRSPTGDVFGAMGITAQNTVGVTMDSCWAHHCRASSFVGFQSVNGTMTNCVADATVPTDKVVGNGCMNFERTAGWKLVNCTFTARQHHAHITHSNDSWSLSQGGQSYPVNNGAMTIVNPTYNDLWGNNLLTVQSWTPYWNGDTMKTPPVALKADGLTHLPYNWVHGQGQLVN